MFNHKSNKSKVTLGALQSWLNWPSDAFIEFVLHKKLKHMQFELETHNCFDWNRYVESYIRFCTSKMITKKASLFLLNFERVLVM